MKAHIIFPLQNLCLAILKFALSFLLLFSINQVVISQTTHFVINGNDSGPGSLRMALSEANNSDMIRFIEDVDTIFPLLSYL